MFSEVSPSPCRDRVLAALEWRRPDIVPLEYHASPSGFYEHGQRLADLWARHPDDFGPPARFAIPDGRFEEVTTDEWGVTRRTAMFGTPGVAIQQPLSDWSGLGSFAAPAVPATTGPLFETERARAARYRERYYLKTAWISIFELMHALRSFEDVLADIGTDGPEINRLADLLVEHHASRIRYLIARGVDAIQIGDDFGTQMGLMLSPKMWRAFFKPRYDYLIRLAHEGGARVFFHCCGCVRGLLDDFVDLHVDAIWPQLNAYDVEWLARYCRQAKLPVAIHPDRGEVMIRSSPEQVRDYVRRLADVFEVDAGGAWFYVEIDAGFPFANVEALTTTIAALRETAVAR